MVTRSLIVTRRITPGESCIFGRGFFWGALGGSGVGREVGERGSSVMSEDNDGAGGC